MGVWSPDLTTSLRLSHTKKPPLTSRGITAILPNDAHVKLKLPTAPDVCTLGTLSAKGEDLETKCLETVTEFKQEGREERDIW